MLIITPDSDKTVLFHKREPIHPFATNLDDLDKAKVYQIWVGILMEFPTLPG